MNGNVRGYCRVSTDLQSDGVSLEIQAYRISAYCVAHGLNLIKMYHDICSGKDMNRPQFQSMLSELVLGETVSVLDLSRLSRSTIDGLSLLAEFDKRGIGFLSITQKIDTTAPEGRFMMTMVMALNQMERENTARKVSSTMQALSAQGKLRSRPPFGWKFVGTDRDYEAEPSQQLVLEKIKELYESGRNFKQIGDALNAQGYNQCLVNNKKTPEKHEESRFYHHTIKRILVDHGLVADEKHPGVSVDQRIVSHHKPIIEIVGGDQ